MELRNMLLLQGLFLSALYDFCFGLIPNSIVLVWLFLGTAMRLQNALQIWPNLFSSLITASLLVPMFQHYHAGGGDVKLLSLIVFWKGIIESMQLILPGLLIALAALCTACVMQTVNNGKDEPVPEIPLAVPIFLGAVPVLII